MLDDRWIGECHDGCIPCEKCFLLLREMVAEALAAERERGAQIAETQPYYPDEPVDARQQWVKDQIAEKIRHG